MSKPVIQKKICMIGDFAVGKTSLIRRFVFNQFDEKYLTTIGVHITRKEIELDKHTVQLMIWDLAGEDGFHKVSESYLAGSTAAIIVGDLSRPQTLDNMTKHVGTFQELQGDLPYVLAFNKEDLIRSDFNADKFAREYGLENSYPSFRTSSKSGNNVEAMFTRIASMLIDE